MSRPFTLYTLARSSTTRLIDVGPERGLPAYAGSYVDRVTGAGDVLLLTPTDLPPRALAAALTDLVRHLENGTHGHFRPADPSVLGLVPTDLTKIL